MPPGPVPPGPVPPGAGPPAPPRPGKGGRSRRKLLIVAGSVVALGTAAAVAFVVLSGGEDEPGKPRRAAAPAPAAWTKEAGRQLNALPGLRYDGTVTVSGRPVQVMLKVTQSGLATGTLTAGGVQSALVSVDGSTYVKGGSAFWRTYSGEAARASSFAGRWARLPATFPSLASVQDALSPQAIAKLLAEAPADPPTENVGTTRAYKVKTSKADYFLTASAPYRLLRVQTAGQGDPRFTAAPLADPALAFTEMRPRVAALGGAADPSLRFQPSKPSFINCNDNMDGCTLSVPATMTVPAGAVPAGARAALLAKITAKSMTLGSCTAAGAVPSGRQVTLRCKVSSRGWRAWMRQAREVPGPHPYEGHARVLGEAVAVSDVARLVGLVDRERAERRGAPGSGAPSAKP
ncbi:hypothetical protein [Actinomadura vinacea]|uniref:hypothetical protein n=1 Tax=Actinomadura vinacea TaxID=115336 RepID=UPI0031D3EEDF